MSVKTPKLPTGLSPSTIDLFHQCQRKFYEQKILGAYDPPGREAVLGTFVHLILEKLMGLPAPKRTPEQALLCAREAWGETETDKDFLSLKLAPEEIRDFKWKARGSVENYFQMQDPPAVEVVATEAMVSAVVNGVPLRGIIDRLDRVDNSIQVSDYKNGKVPDAKYAAPKLRQLNFYAAMVEETRNETPKVGKLLFTAHKVIMETEFTEDSVGAVLEDAENTWTSIHESFESGTPEAWPPSPGPLCGWCPVLERCPEGMGDATMRFKRGRLKSTAPGYALVATPRVTRMPKSGARRGPRQV